MSVSAKELREKIKGWGLSQAEFARWLQVSTGAVAQWLAEARSIPGPVSAYVKLFESLPPSLQERELSNLQKGNAEMEGMYVVEFTATAGTGGASLTFKDGVVYGFDIGGGIYDGTYRASSNPGMTIVEVAVSMPAGQPSVIRNIVQPFDWTILATAEVPNNVDQANIRVDTNLGESLVAKFTRMRSLPKVA